MKFTIYKGQKKITVDNAWIHDIGDLTTIQNDITEEELQYSDLQLFNLRITSSESVHDHDHQAELEKETSPGIIWSQQTVN
jgi:hypothetical protein